jgi:hypothetical protein
VRLNSFSKLILCFVLCSCAHAARDLPPDLSHLPPSERLLPGDDRSPEYLLPCDELKKNVSGLTSDVKVLEESLISVQSGNRTKAIVGYFFTPIMLSLDNASDTKEKLDELYVRKEKAVRIFQSRCSGGL